MIQTRFWLRNDDGNLEVQFHVLRDGKHVTMTKTDYSSGHELGRPLNQRTVPIEEARKEYAKLRKAGFKKW
jgi:hypothetical protein